MMFHNLGFSEMLLILFIGFLLFGPKKLPELGRAAGQFIRQFKEAINGSGRRNED